MIRLFLLLTLLSCQSKPLRGPSSSFEGRFDLWIQESKRIKKSDELSYRCDRIKSFQTFKSCAQNLKISCLRKKKGLLKSCPSRGALDVIRENKKVFHNRKYRCLPEKGDPRRGSDLGCDF